MRYGSFHVDHAAGLPYVMERVRLTLVVKACTYLSLRQTSKKAKARYT